MSRTATATPPPPYFPQRNTTPTLRHASAPNVSQAHFARTQGHTPEKRRRMKNIGGKRKDKAGFESLDKGKSSGVEDRTDDSSDSTPSLSSSSSVPSTSLNTPTSDTSFILQQHPPPISVIPATPSRSWVPNFGFGKVAKAVSSSISWSAGTGEKRKKDVASPIINTPNKVPLLAPLDIPPYRHQVELTNLESEEEFMPQARALRIPANVLEGLGEEEVKKVTREWAEAQHQRLTECARLCSQWPQSGYNISKWGPNGAKHFYEPQSYANPDHVAGIMSRQSALEQYMLEHDGLYYPHSNQRYSTSSTDSVDNSALPSPTSTDTTGTVESELMKVDEQTAEDIRLAMTSPLLSTSTSPGNISQVSLILPLSPKSLKAARSLTELNKLASLVLNKDKTEMEVDTETDTTSIAPSSLSLSRTADVLDPTPSSQIKTNLTRPARAQSCGSKRPLPPVGGIEGDEEKRRKVDEAMVLQEAVSTGVIQPPPSDRMTHSTPELGSTHPGSGVEGGGALFGHVVKTSDTHPIIISPFFPVDLLPLLATHLLPPPPGQPKPVQLRSDIDVPALLLSHSHSNSTGGMIVPSPVSGSFPPFLRESSSPSSNSESSTSTSSRELAGSQTLMQTPRLGNLLLSSCPGKRLRMDGPVKGRGPVCRDIKTDLRRIKAEGVGCLVCCLDDTELALLGTPWESYKGIANEIGLDIIRLPMPDGFTPVSLKLFDSQITLIASKYTLKGVNVLVHCRGGVGRAGVTACAWAIKMGFVQPHPSLALVEETAKRRSGSPSALPTPNNVQEAPEVPAELEHQIVMSIVERGIAMIRSRRGLKAIESFEQVQFLAVYVRWLRAGGKLRDGGE